MIFFPSHEPDAPLLTEGGFEEWRDDAGNIIGCRKETADPKRIWLMFHGNAGQAAHRSYVLPLIPPGDSFFVMEYPGYGSRSGSPSKKSMNEAAAQAYQTLRASRPNIPICILGESIGSGPASHVASQSPAPDRVVLVVPFAKLADVAQEKIPFLPVRWLILDRWDNEATLREYQGRVDIYGALRDRDVPIHHAIKLAQALPHAVFHEIDCEHNEWADTTLIRLD